MTAADARRWFAGRSWFGLSLLILLLLALVLLLAGISVWQIQRDVRHAAESRATSAAYVAATHVRWLVEANLQALRRIAESISELSESPITTRDLDAIVSGLPGQVYIWVFDADGESILTTHPDGTSLNVAEREYFTALRDGAERYIGPWIVDRVTDQEVFPISLRIERDGAFLGAAVIHVPADVMAEFWRSMNLGEASTVGLIRDDGMLIVRHPLPDEPLDLSDYVLFTDLLPKAPSGVYRADASPADGVSRIVGYRRVDDLPLVVAVGVPSDALAAGFRSRIQNVLVAILPVSAALIVVSLWLMLTFRRDARSREQLAHALEQNRVLLREVHHRVKNNLQTVAALISLQPGPSGPKQELVSRIRAMSAVHEHIYATDRFDSLNVADYIRTLVDGLQRSSAGAASVNCRLAPIEVGPDTALPLGLIVNEVVSNAFKHAFPDGRSGHIAVTLERKDAVAALTVRDDGIGYTPSDSGNMGMRLIDSLTRQIGGRHGFRIEGGTVFTLEFPLPSDGERSPAEETHDVVAGGAAGQAAT